jgi:hypothetical protein
MHQGIYLSFYLSILLSIYPSIYLTSLSIYSIGWLLKKGGLGVGNSKSWIKRYCVLYQTSQGHFLAYYSDFTECPLYSQEPTHRNLVDICKTCFIRPGSNKSDSDDQPPFGFDIVCP